jgi:hypothetical protein
VKKENRTVSDYQRITSYLYEYNGGIRGENVGFIRLETRDDQLKISFTLNLANQLSNLQFYFYYYDHGKMFGILWNEQKELPKHYEYKDTFDLETIFKENLALSDMDGILLYDNDSHFFGSQWNDTPINLRVFEKSEKETPTIPEEPVESQEVMAPMKESKTYPEILPYPASDFSSCIKIKLEDLPDFPDIPKELSENGFLKMQVQNYGHLFLGQKVGSNSYYIGIPGVFTNQRNFTARLFGFPEFLTVPHNEQKTGNFGYWIMRADH